MSTPDYIDPGFGLALAAAAWVTLWILTIRDRRRR